MSQAPMVNIAVRAARKAGDYIVRQLDRGPSLAVDRKGTQDFVTEVDRRAEAIVIDTLAQAYPDHGFLGEESGSHGQSDYQWIIDPLDGTTNFLHTYPQFAVSIAMRYKGRLEHGVVYDPFAGELFTTSRGQGAQLNGSRIRVSRVNKLENALLATGFPQRGEMDPDAYLETFRAFFPMTSGIRRAGAAALDLAYVAAGRVDGFWEFGLKLWDIAAGALLVQEAGGLVGDPLGGHQHLESGNVVAANSKVFKDMVMSLRNCRGWQKQPELGKTSQLPPI
jgi:myo-inositol-1(or 4)-monophosphatase